MKKIDELILKILQLKPQKFHEVGSNKFNLIYKDITLSFWNMDNRNGGSGLVRVDSSSVFNISEKTRVSVMKYFQKEEKIDDLLIRVNKYIRKEKLKDLVD